MAEEFSINLTGIRPYELHIHVSPSSAEILDRLTAMEAIMSDVQASLDAQTEAIVQNTAVTAAALARVDEDVANLKSLLDQSAANLAAALQVALDDQVQIDALTASNEALMAEATAAVGRISDNTAAINAATATLAAVDPDPTFPAG